MPFTEKGFNVIPLLNSVSHSHKSVFFPKRQIIFSQGDPSDSVFYIEKGTVKLTFTSAKGKEALVELLDAGNLLGETCLAFERPTRFYTAIAVTDMQVFKIDRRSMMRTLRVNSDIASAFTTYLLRRNQEIRQDLAMRLVNSSEERLTWVLSNVGRLERRGDEKPELRLSQQDLADLIGITRQRTNVLLKRLKKLNRADPRQD